MSATPRPWEVTKGIDRYYLHSPEGCCVVGAVVEEQLLRLARQLNSLPGLVAALRDLLPYAEEYEGEHPGIEVVGAIVRAERALAAAEEG